MSESEGLLNSEEVDFLLDADGTAGKPPVGGVAQEVTMRGDLDQISLSDIFQTLAIAKMEGLFRVRNPLEQRLLHFRNGFVRIMVPNRVASRRLGQRLVQAGMVAPEMLRTALLEQRRDHLPLGQILVRQGYISHQQIEEVVSMQATEELFALFTWRHGTFEFYKGAVTDPQVLQRLDQCVEFEVNSLLLEVARRTDEWECIIQAIGNLDEVAAVDRDALAAADELSEEEAELLKVVDGKLSYRELAEGTLGGLFDSARTARVLAEKGLLRNLADEAMIDTAREQLELGNQKRALIRLQTLRDRGGERSSVVLMAMADLLRQCGEGRLGSMMLLEIAQRKNDPREALDLARQARAASGRDPDVLTFLRSCILQLGGTTPQELEEVTLALLDELIDRDNSEAAMAVIAECEQDSLIAPQILTRKARLLQRHKDIPGATAALLRIVEHPDVVGNRARMIDVYEQVLKMDRSRRDIYKLLKQLRSTRTAKLARIGILAITMLLLVAGAVVFVHRQQTDQSLARAAQEVGNLLRQGDRTSARRVIEHCREQLGDHEQLDDLQRQIEFAEATEAASLHRAQRKQDNEKLAAAAELLTKGDLEASLAIYRELHTRTELRAEVTEVVDTRLEAMRSDLELLAKSLAAGLPPPPGDIPDRKALEKGLNWLNERVQPGRLRQAEGVIRAQDTSAMPEWVNAELGKRLNQTARTVLPLLQQALERQHQIEAVWSRTGSDLKLAPIYEDARRREREMDFAGALDCYRRLEHEHSDDKMRRYFRDQVERYVAIVQYLDTIAAAEKSADFATAQSQYRALRLCYADLPFDRLVHLPLTVDSRPPGATVLWNGQDAGRTPLHLSFLPGVPGTLVLQKPGFADVQTEIRGDQVGAVKSLLALVPDWDAEIGALVEQTCSADGQTRVFTVDRAGVVTALDANGGGHIWQWPSGDLSGYLSPPLRFQRLLLVASLDGTARAIDTDNGQPAWQLDGLATDVAPVLAGPVLAIATTDKRIGFVDAARGRRQGALPLPERAAADLVAISNLVLVLCQDGSAVTFNAATGVQAWVQRFDRNSVARACTAGHAFILLGENGQVRALDSRTGNVLWSKNLDSQVEGAPASNGRDLCVVLSNHVLLLDPASGAIRAQSADNEAWTGTPVLLKDRVAVPVRDGSWRVLSRENLDVLYQLHSSKRFAATGTAWRDVGLLLGTKDRKLAFFRRLP
jgi:outer membrane protein assembly factor BamB